MFSFVIFVEDQSSRAGSRVLWVNSRVETLIYTDFTKVTLQVIKQWNLMSNVLILEEMCFCTVLCKDVDVSL